MIKRMGVSGHSSPYPMDKQANEYTCCKTHISISIPFKEWMLSKVFLYHANFFIIIEWWQNTNTLSYPKV
jgi:polyisoprenoid-binding protein YceI